MSDSYAEKVSQEQGGQPETPEQPARSYSITVTMQPNGQLELTGPIGNKVLANGLLQAGLQELHRWHLLRELEQMAKASNGQGLMGLLKKMGRG